MKREKNDIYVQAWLLLKATKVHTSIYNLYASLKKSTHFSINLFYFCHHNILHVSVFYYHSNQL